MLKEGLKRPARGSIPVRERWSIVPVVLAKFEYGSAGC